MINGQTLLATLENQQAGKRRVSVAGVVVGATLALIAVAFAGGILTFTVYRLWLAWQTGQWDGFWMLTLDSMLFLFLPMFALIPVLDQQRRLAPAIPALREIAAAREDALTPPVVPQPVALPDDATLMGAIEVGPLKRLMTVNPTRSLAFLPTLWLVFFIPFMFLLTGTDDIDLGPILPFSFDPFRLGSPFFNLFPIIMVVFFVLVIGAVVVGIVVRASSVWATMTVSADAEGVRWRARGFAGERRIAWRDVRSFSRITTTLPGGTGVYAAMYAGLGVIYLLDGPDVSLLWSLAPTANDRMYAASEQMCRLIVSRTGLPLRDLTSVANDLALTRGNVQRIMMMRSVTGSGATASPTLQLLALTPPARPARVGRRVASILAVSLVPLLLSAAIFGYGGYVEHYQQGYFASLPQRLHAEMPIYTDAMNIPDSDWPVGAPTKKAPQGERFTKSDYQLYGTPDPTEGNWVWTLGPGIVGDAAFEVTATERGPITSGASDGIGLIFDIDQDGNNFNMFQVNADGSWVLFAYHYDASDQPSSWNWIDSGKASAIRKGVGATNTLLVVKRGKVVLLYANNHLIETYYDRDNQLASRGYVGLFLNDLAQTGDFSNVGVYPVQPPSSEWWV